ncbi:hypothetical protein F5Y08DRAFT_341073 [Xylaria arbuscula]|nr:hypothetical protein F5Y08DRAFT_341073 [Xylaria arbuscula]
MSSDLKQKARASELMSQLKGDSYKENETNLQHLAKRGEQLSREMYENSVETQHMMSGREPWDLESEDTLSDTGSHDTAYLTPEATAVIEKEYVLISGHYALITYRKQLDQVDPYLLLKLREKREREIARWEARNKEKREGKKNKRDRDAKPQISETLAQLTGMKPTPRRSVSSASSKVSKASDGLTDLQERLARARLEDAELRSQVSQKRQSSLSLKSDPMASVSSLPSLSSPPSLSDLSSMTFTTSSSVRSFRARAQQTGFYPINSANSSKRRVAQVDEDVDIWLKVADEES